MLGRKQRINNQDWLDAIKGIERSCSRSHIEELANRTIADIRQKCFGKRAAYSWSGGKDSLVLGSLCERAGVKQCFIVISDLEYPAFLQWVTDHMPDELEVVNTGQNLKWLSKHGEMLFPQDSATAAKWFSIVQHRGQAKYYKEHGLDMIILGRRKADGNFCGRGRENIYTNAQGITRFSPISEWTHEEVLAYIHYNRMPIPPPSTGGRTATIAERIHGLQGNGREASKTVGERCTILTSQSWKRRQPSFRPQGYS